MLLKSYWKVWITDIHIVNISCVEHKLIFQASHEMIYKNCHRMCSCLKITVWLSLPLYDLPLDQTYIHCILIAKNLLLDVKWSYKKYPKRILQSLFGHPTSRNGNINCKPEMLFKLKNNQIQSLIFLNLPFSFCIEHA